MTVKKDDVFTVNVTIENVPLDPGIVGIQFSLVWDPAILTALKLTDVVFHEVTPSAEYDNIWQLQNKISEGQVEYAYTWLDANRARAGGYLPISGNHTVATIEFKALSEGTTSLRLWTLIVADPNGQRLGYVYFDSTVNVIDCVILDINRDGKVDLYDAILLANAYNSTPGKINWNPNADINGDNIVDIYDAILLANHYNQHYP